MKFAIFWFPQMHYLCPLPVKRKEHSGTGILTHRSQYEDTVHLALLCAPFHENVEL